MAYNLTPKPSAEIMSHLSQWLKVYTGGRVSFSHSVTGWAAFLVFKCSQCQNNHHEGEDNFMHGEGIPFGLVEFCKIHRHICSKFVNAYGLGGVLSVEQGTETPHSEYCGRCKWPFTAHDKELWMAQALKAEQAQKLKPVQYWMRFSIPDDQPAPKGHSAYEKPMEPVKIYSGRKFRDDTD